MKRLHVLPAMALLAGCNTVGPDFHRPDSASDAGYADANPVSGAPQARLGENAGLRWWEAFGSPEINALVERALAGNRTLAASTATLEQARERIRAVAGQRLPQIDASARIQHQQRNLAAFGFDPSALGAGSGNPEFDLYTVGGGISFDPDVFGGQRRATEQVRAEGEAQEQETAAAHLTVIGRVVLQALTIAALNDRIATEQDLLGEGRRNVFLTQARQRAGAGTMVEVLSAQGQLAADQGSLPELEQQRTEARTMLAILLGISPAELGETPFSLEKLRLPESVPVALPSELVHQRPDILAAEARLHAATAAIGVATAKLYPSLTLGATLEQAANHPGDIASSSFRGFDIFAGLAAPIFHGGTLKANKRGAEAEARAAAARYQQTVLEAFGQVSDLLAALGNDAQAVTVRDESRAVADRSLHLSRRSFEVGNSGILQVLDASRLAQQARLRLLDARSRQMMNVARLYVATAGGWSGNVPMANAAEPAARP